MRFISSTLCAAVLAAYAAGCAKPPAAAGPGHGPGAPVRAATLTGAPAAVQLDMPLPADSVGRMTQHPADFSGSPDLSDPEDLSDLADLADAGSPAAAVLAPLRALSGGLVSVGEFGQEPEPRGYGTQLLPRDTDLAAQHDAELWAPDAKQMYVAAGFWRTPYLGITKHVFYSELRDLKYIIYFKVFKGIVKRRVVKAGPDYKTAVHIMRGAQDVYSYDLIAAHDRARLAAYRPNHPITVGVLIHPLVIGPCWVFLDNPDDQRPLIAIRAKDGMIFREGDLPFEAIKILVQKSDDEL